MNKLSDMTVGAFEDNIAVSNEAAFLPEWRLFSEVQEHHFSFLASGS